MCTTHAIGVPSKFHLHREALAVSTMDAVEHFPRQVAGETALLQPMEVRAPYDGRLLATVDVTGEAGVDQALSIAHALFRDRDAWLPRPRRIAILRRAAGIVAERAESRVPPTASSIASKRCAGRRAT
jgi:hypothetical protein